MIKKLKQLDKWLDSHLILMGGLLLMLILRIPNLFEPYWYGDEGIYLTVGNGLKQGLKLYSQIIDHKTPIIYYLAMVPNQLWFRVLNIAWMTVTTILFYHLARRILKSQLALTVAMVGFVLFTTLPWLEGNIPNGELFVMGFVLAGSYFLSLTKVFNDFFQLKSRLNFDHDYRWLFAAGVFFGLGILTKVPALFDLAAFASIFWFAVFNQLDFPVSSKKLQTAARHLPYLVNRALIVLYGVITPILISIVYFISRGSGKEYLEFGFLYNFRYAGSWQLNLHPNWLNTLFTFPAKVGLVSLIMIGMSVAHKKFSNAFKFIMAWLLFALFATLLSNRPYPHYFIQTVPPLALLAGYLIKQLQQKYSSARLKLNKLELSLSLLSVVVFGAILILLNVGLYPTVSYYLRFLKLGTGQISETEYFQEFDQYMTDNLKASHIIREAGVDSIFIWGTNPMLYAESGTRPSGRFTVSFHIKDFNAFQETIEAVKADQPEFIIIMDNEKTAFPELRSYVYSNYIINSNFDHFEMWKKKP